MCDWLLMEVDSLTDRKVKIDWLLVRLLCFGKKYANILSRDNQKQSFILTRSSPTFVSLTYWPEVENQFFSGWQKCTVGACDCDMYMGPFVRYGMIGYRLVDTVYTMGTKSVWAGGEFLVKFMECRWLLWRFIEERFLKEQNWNILNL